MSDDIKPQVDVDGFVKGKIPASFYQPSVLAFSIDSLQEEDRLYRLEYFAGEEFLFQYRIPPFQRPVVWTDEQCIAFCESGWKKFNLGSYTVNWCEWVGQGLKSHPHPYDKWLIDGLQRLTALKRYFNDEFSVFGYLWSELDRIDKCRFGNTPFPQARVAIYELEQLKELYNAMNYGGTPHTEEQRAK